MAIKILIVTPALNASSVIGITKPLIELEKRGLVTLRLRYGSVPFGWKSDCDWCDIAVFNRAQGFRDLMLLYYLKRTGKKVIYDIDDNFLEIPISLRVGQMHRFYPKIHGVTEFYKLSDIVRVYTPRMAEQVKRYGGNADHIKCYFDTNQLNGLTRDTSDKTKIAFATARIDDPQLDRMMNDALCHISDKYGDKIEIHLWRKPSAQLRAKDNVILHSPTHNYDSFIKKFYEIGFDIGLAPLMEHPFYQSKSNNKYREYGGMKIAGIYSNLSPYKDSIDHLKTGYLADNKTESWIDGLSHLIENKDARDKIARDARDDIEKHYSFESNIVTWYEEIKSVSINTPPSFQKLPYLHNISAFGLKILVSNFDKKDAFYRATPIMEMITEVCAHLNVKIATSTFQNSFLKGKCLNHKRYYIIPESAEDIVMVLPIANQNAYMMIDLTLFDGALTDDIIAKINQLLQQNGDRIFLIGTGAQLHYFNHSYKFEVKDIAVAPNTTDRFKEDYVGLPRYRAIEQMAYNIPYSRLDKIRNLVDFICDKLNIVKDMFWRRFVQLIGLISWRLGRRI